MTEKKRSANKHTYLVISGAISADVECDTEAEAMDEVRKARAQGDANVLIVKGIIHRLHPVEVLRELSPAMTKGEE